MRFGTGFSSGKKKHSFCNESVSSNGSDYSHSSASTPKSASSANSSVEITSSQTKDVSSVNPELNLSILSDMSLDTSVQHNKEISCTQIVEQAHEEIDSKLLLDPLGTGNKAVLFNCDSSSGSSSSETAGNIKTFDERVSRLGNDKECPFTIRSGSQERVHSLATCTTIDLMNQKKDRRLYYDNELGRMRPATRRTCSFPLSNVSSFSTAFLVCKNEINKFSKKVRFADAFGFDLTSVFVIENNEDPPTIPQHVLDNLDVPKESLLDMVMNTIQVIPSFLGYWKPLFPLRSCNNKLENVFAQQIVLETVRLDTIFLDVTALVNNVGMEKTVFLRLTMDDWVTSTDYRLHYTESRKHINVDRFSLRSCLPERTKKSRRIQFALCYQVNQSTYWDNNQSQNYVFERIFQ